MKPFLFPLLLCLLPLSLWGQEPPNRQNPNEEMVPKSIPAVTGADESSGSVQVNYALLIKQKEAEVEKLVEMYRKAEPSEKDRLRQGIEDGLDLLFELNVRKREMEIKDLESEIQDVQRGLDFRKINKEKIVQNRLKELIGE